MTELRCFECEKPLGKFARPGRKSKAWCGEDCRKIGSFFSKETRACARCGIHFRIRFRSAPLTKDLAFCTRACAAAHNGDRQRVYANERDMWNASYARRRARKNGVGSESFSPMSIFERDGWICGICDSPVDPALRYPDTMSVSLDHIVPLSRGGAHSRSNVQCAHLLCNSLKQNRLF